jgi:hypothetical protein
MNDSNDVPAIFAGFGLFFIFVLVVMWLVLGGIAALVAPDDRRLTFFWLTFLLLGPLGVHAAAIASPRDPAFAPSLRPVSPPRSKPALPAQEALKVGNRVKVADPGGKHDGMVGVIDEITDETDGYNVYVAFGNDPRTHAFSRRELRLVTVATSKPQSKASG